MGILDGKVIVITGAGRGIGRAHALEFAAAGAQIVVNDCGTAPDGSGSDPSVAAAVAGEIGAERALANSDDVSTRAGVERLMAAALARFGRIDGLVHNAGFVNDAAVVDLDDARWEASLKGLLTSTFLMVQAVSRHLIERGAAGRILATTSLLGVHGAAGLASYTAAKAGIIGFCKSASMELKPHGIAVNVLSPLAYTRLTAPMFADVPNAAELLKPEAIAQVALYLMSPLAENITGEVVDVQGPRVSVLRTVQGESQMPNAGATWTPEELHERWASF